jgi:ABC-type nitrate/sulfonate/bicarbonate transport system permease component
MIQSDVAGSQQAPAAVLEPAEGRLSTARKAARRLPPLRGLLPFVALLVVWQFTASGSHLFPPPSTWFSAIGDLWRSGGLGRALESTIASFLGGLLLATVIGSIIGIGVGRSRFLDRMLGPALEFCRVMPAPAVVPIAVLFGGYSYPAKLAVIVFASVWPVLLQVRTGCRTLPPTLFDVARVLQLSRWQRTVKIILPTARRDIFLGTRVAAPVALITTLLVELLTSMTGLGALIGNAQSQFQASQVWGLILICGVFGLIVNLAVAASE